MGGKPSTSKSVDVEISTRKDIKNDSDDTIGCCIQIKKLRSDVKSTFSCCLSGDTTTDNVIVVGNKNRIVTTNTTYNTNN